MKFPIGTKFKTRGKSPRTCTVVDYHVTTNLAGEIVKQLYIAEHVFLGQTLRNEYLECSIAMGLIK